jgi:hypothetical protein
MLRMKTMMGLFALGAFVLPAAAQAKEGPPPEQARAPARETSGRIDPRADEALHRMTDYVASLKSLRVDTTTIDEKVSTEGQRIQEVKDSRVMVQRPNRIAIDRTGPNGHVLFRYDGKRFVVYSVDQKVFATAPAPATMEAAVDEARDRYGLDAPGGDLITADAYQSLTDGVTEGRYIGMEPIGGVMTHHIAMRKGSTTDYELWIADGPEPVPVRYVIVSRDVKGAPSFTIELKNFAPNVPLSASAFDFIPPPGATKVAFSRQPKANP